MSVNNKIQHTKNALVDALQKSLGVVTTACKMVGIDRTTYYRYYNEDEEFRAKCDDIGEMVLDFAESSLHKLIKDGNLGAVIFYLKCKGRNRGYVEKLEHEVNQSRTLNIMVEEQTKKDLDDFIDDLDILEE